MSDRRGMTLVIALATMLVAGSLACVAITAGLIRLRLVADARWQVEATLVASSALGSARLLYRTDLDTLSDGATLLFAPVLRPDGWSWRVTASRAGPLVTLDVTVARRGSDSAIVAGKRASLLLSRDAADTLRVLARRPRF